MKMITLKSSDQMKFIVPEVVAKHSLTIREITEDDHTKSTIRLLNINSKILKKVILYCKKHVTMAEKTVDASKPQKAKEELKKWDAEFLDTDIDTLNDLILAADSLNIPGLLDGACQKVADMLKEKSPEEVREIFKIENEFTPEEEEEIRRQNAWAFV